MAAESLIELDNNGVYITNFGAVAAAKDLSFFKSLDRKRIRVVRYGGSNKVETTDEQLGQTRLCLRAFEICVSTGLLFMLCSDRIKSDRS
jgi:predicted HTH transcriptional regulator